MENVNNIAFYCIHICPLPPMSEAEEKLCKEIEKHGFMLDNSRTLILPKNISPDSGSIVACVKILQFMNSFKELVKEPKVLRITDVDMIDFAEIEV